MEQDEIIEIAKKAGFPFNKYDLLQGDDEGEIDAHEMFEAFAKLVAEAAASKAVEREREACAKVCEEYDESWYVYRKGAAQCAASIRARGAAQ